MILEFLQASIRACEYPVEDILDALRSLGGPGSGNFGHAGRPGEIGGSASSNDPFLGEVPGKHTPAAAKRLISYLERETGMTFRSHGSTGRGEISDNDIDLRYVDPTEGMSEDEEQAYLSKLGDEANRAQDEIRDKYARGEITEQEMMEQIFGDSGPDPLETAFKKIGFKPVKEMGWMGISVIRWRNEKTNHTVEVWAPSGDQGDAESGPPSMVSRDLGGPGSGNFGHAGRPGEVGGSSPAGKTDIEIENAELEKYEKDIANSRIRTVKGRANDVAELMGVDPKIINVVDKEPRQFVVGNQGFKEAGHFNPSTKMIEVNARNSYHPEMNVTYGIVAHEVSHAMWNAAKEAKGEETQEINSLPADEFNRLFQRNGFVRPDMQKEALERWPVSAFFYKHLGDPYMETEAEHGQIGRQTRPLRLMDELKKADGISDYSKAYWEPSALNQFNGFDRAVDETLAEATRFSVVPSFEHDPYMGIMPKLVRTEWKNLSEDLQRLVKTNPKVRNRLNRGLLKR